MKKWLMIAGIVAGIALVTQAQGWTFKDRQAVWEAEVGLINNIQVAGTNGTVTAVKVAGVSRPDLVDAINAVTDAEVAAYYAAQSEAALTPFERATRKSVERLVTATNLSETEIAEIADVFALWQTGASYAIGDVRRYDGQVYQCLQGHTSQSDWTPDAVPALWVQRTPGAVEEWVQPYGGSGTYVEGAIVTHNGQTWVNVHPAPALNVWEPGVFGWELVD